MRSSIRTFGALSGAAAALVLTVSSPAWAKRVICIDGAGGGTDSAINIKEGYERALGITAPPDVVSIGGALTDCLAMVANDDELVIIAHGGPGTFDWGGMTYTGFGMGPGLMPVPAGFAGRTGVRVRFCSCFSANDPPGADTSITSKLLAAMGGAGSGNTVGGFQAESGPGVIPVLCGGTAQQQMMAGDALNNMLAMWTAFPPANRPGTGGPGQPPNQQTAAQQKVDQVVGPGVIVVKIPNQVGMFTDPPAPNVGGYVMPTDGGNLAARSGIGPPTCMGCTCLFFGWVDGGPLPPGIPTVSEWGLIAMGIAFLFAGPMILRRSGVLA